MIGNLELHTYDVAHFDWEGSHGVAYASDLGAPLGRLFARVYDDACDVGLRLVDHTTGRGMTYVVEEEFKTPTEPLAGWQLRSIDGRTTLTIFND